MKNKRAITKNSLLIALILLVVIIAVILLFPKPSQRSGIRCGDGVCGPIEEKAGVCPKDCKEKVISNVQKINIFLVIHTGEGPCEMLGTTSLEDSTYQNCRDKLIETSTELSNLGIKAKFEFLGPFEELLSKDPEFSFENDIISKGHTIGMHAHEHCYYDGVIGSEICANVDLNKGIYWGKVGNGQPPTIDQLLARIDSAMLFNPYNASGGFHGLAYQYKQDPERIINELNNREIIIWTGTKQPIKYHSTIQECSTSNTYLLPHPVTPLSKYPNVVYFDHGPVFGGRDTIGAYSFDVKYLKQRFEKIVKCREAEQSKDNPYIFGMGTHLWNIITNEDSDPNTLDGIADLSKFKKWIDLNYEDTTSFSTIEEIYYDYNK